MLDPGNAWSGKCSVGEIFRKSFGELSFRELPRTAIVWESEKTMATFFLYEIRKKILKNLKKNWMKGISCSRRKLNYSSENSHLSRCRSIPANVFLLVKQISYIFTLFTENMKILKNRTYLIDDVKVFTTVTLTKFDLSFVPKKCYMISKG